jgi:hypothetical protein
MKRMSLSKRETEIILLMNKLQSYWLVHQELRLGQLVVDLSPDGDSPYYMSDQFLFSQIPKIEKKVLKKEEE